MPLEQRLVPLGPRPKPNFEPGAKTCSLRHPETKSGWLCANEAGSRSCLSHLRFLERGAAVLVRLPPPGGPAVDRRVLAQQATGFPHDLDDGQPVAGFCRAFLSVTGRVPEGARPRAAWAAVGVLYDDIVGGLTTVNLVPRGWAVPCGVQ